MNATTQAQIDFPVWKTIKLGTFSDNEALIKALLATKSGELCVEGKIYEGTDGSVIGEQYREQHYLPLLKQLILVPFQVEVDLVRVTKTMLGLTGTVPIKKVWEVAIENGLKLCPQEAGPQLCLQWEGREEGHVRLAMETFSGDWSLPERPPCTFSTGVSFGRLSLGSSYGPGALNGNGDDWSESVWVFIKPRKWVK